MTASDAVDRLVTIVIPTFEDDPAHMREAVASARAQTHPHIEVVVVDDGSSRAETLDVLRTLEESVTVLHQANRGPSAARNTGIRAGNGELIICLDADDTISPTYAAESVRILTDSGDVSIAYPRMDPVGHRPGGAWSTRGTLRLGDFAQRSAVPVSSCFRRANWLAIGGWDESMRTGMEDHEWWVRLLGHTGGVALPLPTARLYYRVRLGSRSRTRPYADDLAETRRRILENNPPDVLRSLLEGAWAATDEAEAEAARAWSDPWQLRRWGRGFRRRTQALVTAKGPRGANFPEG